jgi:hypothetical protein
MMGIASPQQQPVRQSCGNGGGTSVRSGDCSILSRRGFQTAAGWPQPGTQESVMGSVHLMGKSFGPEAIHAMSAAFDSAWQDLEASGNIFNSSFTAVWAREKIAERILTMVLRGERDPALLSDDALAHLARVLPRK